MLAERAQVSQAYIVALERAARVGPAVTGPSPTIEVLIRLADALGLSPAQLFAAALAQPSRHVLLVVEDDVRSPLEHARMASSSSVDAWVVAGPTPDADHTISLRRDRRRTYDPVLITEALGAELERLGPELAGCRLALVFSEISELVMALDDPEPLISFEHQWSEVVTSATAGINARAAWNVCVYELGALRSLPDPAGSTLDLLRSHDLVWAARGREVTPGAPAARRVLRQLCPDGTTSRAWRATTDRLVDGLDLLAS